MTRPGVQRDVSIALELVAQLIDVNRVASRASSDLLFKLQPLLQRMDARTGRRDPSVRKPAKKKTAAKKAARRAVK